MRKVFSIQAIRQTIKEIKQDFKQKTVPEQDVVPEQESVTEDFHVGYSWGHYLINVPRSFSLKFRGDVYNYYILSRSETIKSYLNFHNHDIIELLKDKYDRLWLHVYKKYVFDDRIEETFDLVKDEQEADKLSERGTYHYMGEPPYIHATELNDFILHEDPTEEIPEYIESKRNEIIEFNKCTG